ncbi:endonuclease domain-containing 1 protein-like [Megalobrama amblycephala]|uniref:endonuclease domain-containing 1 protein-like n=1 Tax=Megalobrama amblycephala TaxID=75352 RepID=UPI002013E374|nr:endonuclease domain-containing 1 protein-like [Megalobrama amblycephala]XP_048053713.1 endonuclease domain-containing 1 protein-like [Megalobrama amblycephala]
MMMLLHVLMLSLVSSVSAEVVEDFEEKCGQFFAGRKSPTTFTGSQYEQICQTLNGVVHYATYYDTKNKIPVYSAYRFEGIKKCKRLNKWYIEPNLDGGDNTDMKFEKDVNIPRLGRHQALNRDYVRSGSDRGHLQPVFQANSQSCADATFTLTNAAPQNPSFNRGQWRALEEKMANKLSEQCKEYSAFIVTGVTPGKRKLNNRVNVPRYFWTAYCCLDNNEKCQISGGFFGVNKNHTPKEKTVNDLEKYLKKIYKVKSFKVFDSSTEPAMESGLLF